MIQWRQAMSVGHEVLDGDHKTLLELINTFEAADTPDRIEYVLGKLLSYTRQHFAREEALQRACRYPFQEAHHKAHEKLFHDVSQLCRKWERVGAHDPEMVVEIGAFLRNWLIDHILKEDLPMKSHLPNLRRATA